MNAPKILVIIISVILLVACQTTPSWYWHKDGGSQQDLDQDNYQCLQEAQQQISETYISAYGEHDNGEPFSYKCALIQCLHGSTRLVQKISTKLNKLPYQCSTFLLYFPNFGEKVFPEEKPSNVRFCHEHAFTLDFNQSKITSSHNSQ